MGGAGPEVRTDAGRTAGSRVSAVRPDREEFTRYIIESTRTDKSNREKEKSITTNWFGDKMKIEV